MRPSKFIIHTEALYEEDVLIKNLLSGAIIELDRDCFRHFQSGNIDYFSSEEIEWLQQTGMIVDKDEKQLFWQVYQTAWMHDQIGRFAVIYFAPTSACQLRCLYCYEDGIRRQSMNTAIENQSMDWIYDYLKGIRSEIDNLVLVFHGGEPLLRKQTIRRTTSAIKQICDNLQIGLEVQIVTNGVDLDLDIIGFLSQYNLTRLQITLDGPSEIHNNRRKFVNGSGTYHLITDNAVKILDSGLISQMRVRINIDGQNASDIHRLLETIGKTPVFQRGFRVSLGLVTLTLPNDQCTNSAFDYIRAFGLTDVQAAETYLGLARTAIDHNIEIVDEFIIGPWCAGRHPYAWLIGPDGSIYKCLGDFGRKEAVVGNVFSGIQEDLPIRQRSHDKIVRCLEKECNLVPICGGGCLFDRRVVGEELCPRIFLEKVNSGLLAMNTSMYRENSNQT